MSMLKSLKSKEVPVDALENIKQSSVEVKSWPEWKLKNTLLAFSEYQRKKSIHNNMVDQDLPVVATNAKS